MAARRHQAAVAVAALAIMACAGQRPASAPAAGPGAAAAPEAAATPDFLERLLRVVDGEKAITLRLRGTLQLLPDGDAVPAQLWLARSGALRLQVDRDIEIVCDGATLWTRRDEQWLQEPAARPPRADDLASAVAPFDLVEALLPMPLGLADAALLLERDVDQLRLLQVCEECRPRRPLRAVTLTPDGLRVVRRSRYDAGGEVLRVETTRPGSVAWTRSGTSLLLRIDEMERDPVLPEGIFDQRR